jgi:hypothetical protein
MLAGGRGGKPPPAGKGHPPSMGAPRPYGASARKSMSTYKAETASWQTAMGTP